jgi:hypothetical protein
VSTPEPLHRAASLSAVTKGEYPYPPDEFDAVDPSAGPRGVHRRPRSRWSTVWPFLVALVVSAALAFAVVALVWDDRGPGATAGTDVAAPEATEPAPTGSAPVTTEAPAAEPPATEAPAPVETPAPAPEPDLATPVTVFNSTSVSGLAADAAYQLEDAGWSEVDAGNYPGGTLPSSTVFYGTAELEVSARAVADVLGIDVVELAESDTTEGIEVVLERDFAG